MIHPFKPSTNVHFGMGQKDKKTKGEKFFASVAGNAASGFTMAKTGKPLSKESKQAVGDTWTSVSRKVDKVGGPVMDAIFDPIFGKRK